MPGGGSRVLTVALLLALGGASAEVGAPPAGPGRLPSPDLGAIKSALAAAGTPGPDQILAFARTLGVAGDQAASSGAHVPPELHSVVSRVESVDWREADLALYEAVHRRLSHLAEELVLWVESPDAPGRLALDSPVRLTAGSYAELSQTYSVGTLPMQPGGGLLVTTHWLFDQPLQIDDPAADNYVSVSAPAAARFSARYVGRSGIHGGFDRTAEVLFFELIEGTLASGDRVTVTYGERSGGSRGLRLPAFTAQGLGLPVYVSHRPGGPLVSLPTDGLTIAGGQAARVVGYAPSIVRVDEPFRVLVSSMDRFGNAASGPVPSYDLLVRGSYVARVAPANAPGAASMGVVREVRLSEPGIYRLTLRSSGGGIVGSVNPIKVVRGPATPRINWGDPHVHTGFTTGTSTPGAMVSGAREVSGLDFVAISDPDHWLDQSEWEGLAADVVSSDGFNAFPGYEWMMPMASGGHMQVVYAEPPGSFLPSRRAPSPSRLFHRLRDIGTDDVVIIAHAREPADHRVVDPELVKLVEIQSESGFFEWFGRRYLDAGHRVGFVAGSESHRSRPDTTRGGGLTAVIVPSTDASAVFAALKAGATYATSGERLIVDFRVNGGTMGTRIPFSRERSIEGEVIGTAGIQFVEVIKNGQSFWRRNYLRHEYLEELAVPESTVLDLKVQFRSSSAPVPGQTPLPAPPRAWIGYVRTSAGGFEAIEVDQPRLAVKVAPEALDRADFFVETHGNDRGFLLQLAGYSEDTVLEVVLKTRSAEGESEPGRHRVALMDVLSGGTGRSLGVGDGFEIEPVMSQLATERRIALTDADRPGHGDYYYLRVKQIDDEYAWTSPVWVGGFDAR